MNPQEHSSSTRSEANQRAAIVGKLPTDNAGPGPFVMTAGTLQGNSVKNFQDEDIGTIKEIMLDVQRGQIAYAVMSCGGMMGMGAKLFAVPWAALTLDTDRKCFILNADKEALKKAPGFDRDHWPAMADPAWATEVYSFYKVPLYWE